MTFQTGCDRPPEWWVRGLIPDEVYIQSPEYLIKVGIINVGTS